MTAECANSLFEGSDLACVRSGRPIFRDLSFRLGPGEALVLRGPNGSGKSSLLRLAAGLLAPAEGELRWQGEAVARDPEGHRARIHFVGHLDGLKSGFSAAENLVFWARYLSPETGRSAVEVALERFRMAPLADVSARLLSAGQRRRLALARALLGGRPLWLLDEPTVSLDADAIGILGTAVAEHRAGGGRVIAASHVDVPFPDASLLDLSAFRAQPSAAEA